MNKLLHGDCLELMKNIPDKSIDMILCDLPYGTTACKWDIVIPFEPLWEQYKRIIKDNGAIVLFGTEPFSSHLRLSNLKWFKYDWVWQKNTQTGITLVNKQPMRKTENISVFYNKQSLFLAPKIETKSDIMKNHYNKGYTRATGDKSKSQHFPNMPLNREPFELLINPHNILNFDVISNRAKIKTHPTQKPVALFEYLIKTYTNEGETVLDNCAGSGTTAIAALNSNRKFICMEKDPEYFEIMRKRVLERQMELAEI